MLVALTRKPSSRLKNCELTYIPRLPIDVELAQGQHQQYEALLESWGVEIDRLPEDHDCPDGAFVEDAAIVLDECAIIANMGAPSRKREAESVAAALAKYRRLFQLKSSAALDGGDVLQIDRELFVGVSTRTNSAAISSLTGILEPFGYTVTPVAVCGCLHLKTACTYVGRNTMVMNRERVDVAPFKRFRQIATANDEPLGGNALVIADHVAMPSSCPRTVELVRRGGFDVSLLDISEFLKAEAGLTCLSIIFQK